MRKCLAQVMRTKDGGRRAVVTDQKIAIPETFSGFFEILSEDLKPVKCCESVAELAQKFPEMALVRAACKAYLPESDGELRNLYRTRSVQEGEVLTLVGKFNYKRSQFLRCFDENGNSLYLKLSQRGRFSPIARAEAITGVHVIKNLLHAKRFPLTVRLIQGDFPAGLAKTGHSLVLRLLSGFTEDSVVVYTLQREPEMLSVPMNAYLKVR